MKQSECRYFTGYKPCKNSCPPGECRSKELVTSRIAIIALDAMGAVLRATCILPPLLRKYPGAHVTWITYANAKGLLDNNPMIDRLVLHDGKTLALWDHLEFDLLCSVDKSLEAGALAEKIKAKKKLGFGLTAEGAIRPFNKEAEYQYSLGLDDHAKFHVNKKTENQQTTESMGLKWESDEYVLELTEAETAEVAARRSKMLKGYGTKGVIGFNTGCSVLYPYKKFTVERSIETVAMWRKSFPHLAVALLGGPEDGERQEKIKQAFATDAGVINTPTREGVRSGVLWMATSDMVFSGCSLGMHIGIGLKKPVIAWFGVSCIQEVELYGRGEKIQSDVSCSPCWRKSCDKTPKCYDQVSPDVVEKATTGIMEKYRIGR